MNYLGVDLGGTNIAVGLVSENGTIIHKDSVPTLRERGFAAIIEDLAALCQKVMADSNVDIENVKSIGIGSPGINDNKNGIIIYSNNICLKNAPIRAEVQQYIPLPVFLDNDANCAALGESVGGAAKNCSDSITITLGTGVGSGIIVNNRILSGSYGCGGELGHHVIRYEGEQCTCGRKGCWEAYASATALIREAKFAAVHNPQSALATIVNNDYSKISGKTVFKAAKMGDDAAKTVLEKYLLYVSIGLTNLINIFQPEMIVLGGGLSAQGEVFLEPIRNHVAKEVYGGRLNTQIVVAQLGNDAGIVGAAMLEESK